jgi:hypothetical protein
MDKLAKSNKDRMLFGVCGGLSKYSGIDASLIRIGFIIGTLFTGSLLFWFYLLLAFVLPTQD